MRLLASPTRIEPGCLGCRVWTEDSDESSVRYVEEWATEEAMRLRVRSERFTRLLEVLESAPRRPSVQFDFVTKTRGLDYVAEVRNVDGMLKSPRRINLDDGGSGIPDLLCVAGGAPGSLTGRSGDGCKLNPLNRLRPPETELDGWYHGVPGTP